MPKLFPPAYQFLDTNGDPVNSGTVNFYSNGTTNDKSIFTDASLATAATNAAPLNAAGRFNQGDLYGNGTYTVVLKDSASTQIWSRDDFTFYQFNGQGSDIASATALDVNIEGTFHDVTGTTTITSFTTFGIGQIKVLQFDDALTLTHNSTDLILPGAVNITTIAGDIGVFYEYASADWRCVSYTTGVAQERWLKGTDVVSATGLTLGTDGNYFDITGTTTITSIDSLAVGTVVKLHFDAALTLTHNATDLVLPGSSNILTAAGDEAELIQYATGDWRLTSYVFAQDDRRVGVAGEVTNTSQPAFLAYNSASDDNVTGNGTVATIDFDTEVFDQGGDFAADTFTAPVTGRYLLSTNAEFSGITSAADFAIFRLVTSNRDYLARLDDTNDMPQIMHFQLNPIADMDAGDTVTVTLQVNGESSDVVDIKGGTALSTFFSGCLLA